MPDLDHMIRDELRRAVDRAPTPPSVRDITRPRVAGTEPVRIRRRRTIALQVTAAAAVVVALVVATVAIVDSSGGDKDSGGVVATTPDGAAFVETVDWPHYLPTWLPEGTELQLTEEIRPGGLPGWTTQSISMATRGSLLIAARSMPGIGADTGATDATTEAQGHPLVWLDDQGSPNQASWMWPDAQVLVYWNGLTQREIASILQGALIARGGDPSAGFDLQPSASDFTLVAEHVSTDSQPAITRAWYGTEEQIDLQLQAVAPGGAPATLDLVALGGATEPRSIAGREVLVSTFGVWATAAWFDADGTFLSVQARDIPDADLAQLVAGIGRVDQHAWNEAVSALSDRLALDGAGLCATVDGEPPCVGDLSRRDGGPHVVGPSGLLAWTPVSEGYDFADVIVDGTWWIVGRLDPGGDKSPDVQLETENGFVETEGADTVTRGGPTVFVRAVPNNLDRTRLVIDGIEYGERWRPSS